MAHAACLPAPPPQPLAPLAPTPTRTTHPSPPEIELPPLLREHEMSQSPQMITHQWPPITWNTESINRKTESRLGPHDVADEL